MVCCKVWGLSAVNCAKTAEPLEWNGSRELCVSWGSRWCNLLNTIEVAAMQRYVPSLWPLVICISNYFDYLLILRKILRVHNCRILTSLHWTVCVVALWPYVKHYLDRLLYACCTWQNLMASFLCHRVCRRLQTRRLEWCHGVCLSLLPRQHSAASTAASLPRRGTCSDLLTIYLLNGTKY